MMYEIERLLFDVYTYVRVYVVRGERVNNQATGIALGSFSQLIMTSSQCVTVFLVLRSRARA